jgi:oligoribonuclease NrnB/cAMP/cGMP phosphodiesterase (DHH superfamily)
MNVHCFFHRTDLDGHCSGAIVRLWCERNGHIYVPHGVNYGELVTWTRWAAPEDMAIIVDFTPERVQHGDVKASPYDILARIKNAYSSLVWIDHHATAIDAVYGELLTGCDFEGLRRFNTAACVLTWQHFFPGTEIPTAVSLLGAYDVFDRSNKSLQWDEILQFQYGMRTRVTLPDNTDEKGLWYKLLLGRNEDKENPGYYELGWIIAEGTTVLKYERLQNEKTVKSAAYDCTFNGMLCCAINARGNSLLLESFARPEHKMRILWSFDRNKWRVHLYENGHDDVHCGEIAKKYGGGGHKGAAGFEATWPDCPITTF